MKIKYDKEIDALYIELKKSRVHKTVETRDSFLIDLDKDGQVVGFEVLGYSKTVPARDERFSIHAGQSRIKIPA